MIILFVPELDELLSEARSVPSLFTRIRARAAMRPLDPVNGLSELLLGKSDGAAPFLRAFDRPEDASGVWMVATPISLRPDLNAVWARPAEFASMDDPVIAELGACFEDAGLDWDLPRPDRGYLRLSALPQCHFSPPWMLDGRSLDHALPEGRDAAEWTRLLTECQVILHQHQQADRTVPSGLWFWGPGRLPVDPETRVTQLIGNDDLLRAFAGCLEIPHAETVAEWPDSALLVWKTPGGLDAEQALIRLAEMVRPMWRKLQWGRLDALELASRSRVWRCDVAQSRRVWRRSN